MVALPQRRADLTFRPMAEGQFVAKDPLNGAYYKLGEKECFLLRALDGKHEPGLIAKAYRMRFGEELGRDDLTTFITLATHKGLIESPPVQATDGREANGVVEPQASQATVAGSNSAASGQSLLYFRFRIVDPDALLGWLAPKIGFFWTKSFVIASAALILAAIGIAWGNAHEMVQHITNAVGWEAVVGVWFALIGITMLHEFGHGLTCKRHGGEVREMGLLFMYFLPCLYCNVSDAWLISDKKKRLWITAAGGYVEMCLWAAAVFVWRLTVQDVFIHYLALMVIIVSGFRILFNFNPLLKLDGYYLLSDWLEEANLRQRARDYVAGHLRWLLWGAPRPEKLGRSGFLIMYGIACWFFSVLVTIMMLHLIGGFVYSGLGFSGMIFVAILAAFATRGLFRGLLGGEVRQMFVTRHKRLMVSLLLVGAGVVALSLIHMPKRVHGTFEVCPLTRREVRTPIAAFLGELHVDEGQQVSPSDLAAVLEVPDLDSRIAQKEAEIREVTADLRLLTEGTRPEEIAEQQQKVARANQMRDLAQQNVGRAQAEMKQQMQQLTEKVLQNRVVTEQSLSTLKRTTQLYQARVVTAEVYEEQRTHYQVALGGYKQAVAEKSAREAAGCTEAEQELALREKEFADERGALDLLQAGTREAEIEAEQAERARSLEELKHLKSVKAQLPVYCQHQGTVVTPRVKEKVGQYLKEGDLICVVEELSGLKIEIELPEQELRDVVPGQPLQLKARALPFKTFESTVDRIAPSAREGDVQSSVVIHTQLDKPPRMLRPGMTGYARVECGSQPVGKIMLDRVLQYVRTEFWW